MNGDIITSLPLKSMVASHEAPGTQPTVTMALVPYKSRFGIVYIDKLKVVRKFEEKPEFPDVWINGGVYVINPQKVMKHLPRRATSRGRPSRGWSSMPRSCPTHSTASGA